jgi:hypothetical protein
MDFVVRRAAGRYNHAVGFGMKRTLEEEQAKMRERVARRHPPRRAAVRVAPGQRYGCLVVQEGAGRDRHWNRLWRCLCDCGRETVARGASLAARNTQSCGCLRSEPRSSS